MMSIDREVFEEYRNQLADRYEAIELCELLIDHFGLTAWDVMDAFGDELLMELYAR